MTRMTNESIAAKPVKVLYMGPSGCGKTSSLLSLIQAGYTIRMIDLDKGVGPLAALVKHHCPDRIGQIDLEQVQDELRGTNAGIEIRKAIGFTNTLKLMTKWSDETRPAEWDLTNVLIIDSLTRLSDYAFNYEKKLNPSVKEPRQWFNFAQQKLRQFFDMVASSDFKTNVIIMAHVELQKTANGTMKQLPKSVGKALNPDIPSYFNNMIIGHRDARGNRKIGTVPTHDLDLKNEKPFAFEGELPMETGLADIFKILKEG